MAFDYSTLSQAGNMFTALGQQQKHEIITVTSYQEAKDFKLNKGDSYLLLDPNNDLLYVRECDSIGKNNTRVFSLKEITEEYTKQTTSANITKSDLENLIHRIETLENNKKQENQFNRGNKNAINEQKQ